MTVNTRYANRTIQAYVDQVEEGNTSVPSEGTIKFISSLLDNSFHKAYEATTRAMTAAPLIEAGVTHLHTKRTCGGFKMENASLVDLTAFEQMYAVSQYIDKHPNMSRNPRTYAFKVNDNELVPVWIKHPINVSASLWTTLLGTISGRLKAPPYEDLAKTDPQGTDNSVFINLTDHSGPENISLKLIKNGLKIKSIEAIEYS